MRVKEQDSGLKKIIIQRNKDILNEKKKKAPKTRREREKKKEGVKEQVIDWKKIFLAHCQELKPPNMLIKMKSTMR